MLVRINGAPRQVPDGTTVASLLAMLSVASERVAVVVNEEVVVPGERAGRALQPQDEVEILPFLTGG